MDPLLVGALVVGEELVVYACHQLRRYLSKKKQRSTAQHKTTRHRSESRSKSRSKPNTQVQKNNGSD